MNLDIQKIKPKQMKSILKKLGYNKYYNTFLTLLM